MAEQFLSFELAGEAYALKILKVVEIRGWEPIRPIPNTPSFIKGALNLRGNIVPIIDLRERFALPAKECTPMTVVIVVNIEIEQQPLALGMIVDAVSDVLEIKAEDIRKTPPLGSAIDIRYMSGMVVKPDQKTVLLLNVDKLMAPEELEELGQID
ncbi:MAG: chemotaxis protein CheW [Methylococcales bacterium]|nr:chemotaxis protein CheW [Methylococcales bacterium]